MYEYHNERRTFTIQIQLLYRNLSNTGLFGLWDPEIDRFTGGAGWTPGWRGESEHILTFAIYRVCKLKREHIGLDPTIHKDSVSLQYLNTLYFVFRNASLCTYLLLHHAVCRVWGSSWLSYRGIVSHPGTTYRIQWCVAIKLSQIHTTIKQLNNVCIWKTVKERKH